MSLGCALDRVQVGGERGRRGEWRRCQMFCSSLSMLHVACARQMQLKRLSVAHVARERVGRGARHACGM